MIEIDTKNAMKRIFATDDWVEIEKYILRKVNKMLNTLDIPLNNSNSEVGETVKARKLAALIIKDFLDEMKKSQIEIKESVGNKFR